jgi:poly(3-hydroxybutyrate) depolymerase
MVIGCRPALLRGVRGTRVTSPALLCLAALCTPACRETPGASRVDGTRTNDHSAISRHATEGALVVDARPEAGAKHGAASDLSLCVARGSAPASYVAQAVVGPTVVDLRHGWRMTQGDPPEAQRARFDDSGWREASAVGEHKVLARSMKAKTTVWLRRRFSLPAGLDRATLSIDLGARVGNTLVYLNGKKVGESLPRNAPILLRAPLDLEQDNVVALRVSFGGHVGGLRWTGEPSVGQAAERHRGLLRRAFRSRVDESSQELALYIPQCVDLASQRLPLIVALPGWDGNIYSFAHSRLMTLAEQQGYLVLVPDRRGNRLYTGPAEQGVLEAIELVMSELPVDADRIYLTGVSMGGAGALQIGYHFPDRFAAVAAFYGDSRYGLSGYARGILGDQITADRYSVLLFHENARNLPVLLVHAKDDSISAFEQSEWLAVADQKSGFANHRLIAPETGGHSLQVVEDAIDPLFALMNASRRVHVPERVTFTTNSGQYDRAYWLSLSLKKSGEFGGADVSFDASHRRVVVRRFDSGLRGLRIDLGALGLADAEAFSLETSAALGDGELSLTGLRGCARVMLESAGRPGRRAQLGADGIARVVQLSAGETQVRCEREAGSGATMDSGL